MREREGSCARDAAGSSEFSFGEIVRVDSGERPEEDGAWLDVVSDDGGGEGASFLD